MIITNAWDDPIGVLGTGPPRGKEESTAREGTFKVTTPLEGVDSDSVKEWFDCQIDYENLAKDKDIAQRAMNFARMSAMRFETAITPIHDKWRIIQYTLRGKTFSRSNTARDPVHVPELYKLEETLIPRLEEAIFQYDDWFMPIGKTQKDKAQERVIQQFIEYQLYHARFPEMIQPFFRLLLRYGIAPLKIWWSLRQRDVIEREVKSEYKDGKVTYKVVRREKKKVYYNGPKIRLIDPFDFYVELDATNTHDALFIGDRSWMTYDEIAELGEEGIFHDTDRLAKIEPSFDPVARWKKASRGIEQEMQLQGRVEGAPKKFEIREFWGLFDAFGTGRTREFVITLADNRHVLRVQENPFDDKHRPYAVARAAREPFRFFNVGPMDHGVQLQFQFDENRNLGLDSHRLTVCPIVMVDEQSDIPDSLLGVMPGSVFRVKSPPTWIKSPSTIGDMINLETVLRRDMEEVMGAPRIMQGTEGGNTATEIERKIQEGNQRTRGLVRSSTFALQEMLRQMHALNQQYVTTVETFRVLGVEGGKLTEYTEIDPEKLDADVDFEFIGPSNLQTVGLRATQLQQFLTVVYPFLAQYPNLVDIPVLIRDLFKNLVGTRIAEDVIKVPSKLDDMMDPELENMLLIMGQDVPVHEADDDEAHLRIHAQVKQDKQWKASTPRDQKRLLEHNAWHQQNMAQKKTKKAAMNQINPSVATAPAPQLPAERGTTGSRGNGSGGPMAPTVPGQTPTGETPGPPTAFGTRSPDRKGGMFQTENMLGGR